MCAKRGKTPPTLIPAVRTPAEIVIEVERHLHAGGAQGFSDISSADVLAADRDSH